jgi:hypothetical protein
MLFGQMSISQVSGMADYIQLDICGLSAEEAVHRYLAYQTQLPVILHGDWEKKGNSENNIEKRLVDYMDIINGLLQHTEILGFTMHPTFRKKVAFEEFLFFCNEITKDTQVPVFIENRSNQKIWLSTPEEIISFSQEHTMTIDLPQLFISCQFNHETFIDTLQRIHWTNVREVHMANIKRQPPRTFVARRLTDGLLDIPSILPFISTVPYVTLEILGGLTTFEDQVEYVKNIQ